MWKPHHPHHLYHSPREPWVFHIDFWFTPGYTSTHTWGAIAWLGKSSQTGGLPSAMFDYQRVLDN